MSMSNDVFPNNRFIVSVKISQVECCVSQLSPYCRHIANQPWLIILNLNIFNWYLLHVGVHLCPIHDVNKVFSALSLIQNIEIIRHPPTHKLHRRYMHRNILEPDWYSMSLSKTFQGNVIIASDKKDILWHKHCHHRHYKAHICA